MNRNKEQAKRLLVHYFELCYRNATGENLDSDNIVEIREIIDCIFNEINLKT